MEHYDPLRAPDATDWNDLDEDVRISLVLEHHREAGIELPDETIHAVIHVVVENQIAENDGTVVETLARLMRQGLDRHDAIHAIGSVLAGHIHSTLERRESEPVSHKQYYTRLRKLTAKRWRKGKW
jgi:hypothetical protein